MHYGPVDIASVTPFATAKDGPGDTLRLNCS